MYNKMVRQTKSTAASATPASTASAIPSVTVTVESVAPAPVVEKKPRKAKAPAAEVAAPVAVETAAPSADAVPAPAETAAVLDVATLSSKLTDFSSKIQAIANLLSSMKSDYKTLEKTVARELKQATKSSGKKRRSSANKQPSGFVKPTKISDELIKFLGKDAGTEMSRVEVSKEINAYINLHKLKDEKCGRQINPDAKLTKLLKVQKGEVLTFFNLQRYLKIHFIKAVAPVVA
jgi:chromatin remodeling complex protein RSC6